MTYYKVVRTNGWSIVPHINAILYELDRWIKPTIPSSPLFVFDSLEHAKAFADKEPLDLEVFECEIEPHDIKKVESILIPMFAGNNEYINFWSMRFYENNNYSHLTPPKGTVFAKAVKLTKRVTE